MLRTILDKYHIRFRRENRSKVLFQLLLNLLLERVWKLEKYIRRIKTPVVHLYAVCWNEEKIIPFFLSHYNKFVSNFYIYDNYSDDNTDKLLSAQSNITIHRYDTGGAFNDAVHQKIKNTVWKQSRGKADWVIVIDIDELLYHPDMTNFLNSSVDSILKPIGCNMVNVFFPVVGISITDQVKNGELDDKYGKMALFDPHKIVDINYMPGAHEAYPEGIVRVAENSELKLLHYKNLGIEYVLERIRSYRMRLSNENIENKWGTEYNHDEQHIVDQISSMYQSAIKIID